jgi:hypothetical protein
VAHRRHFNLLELFPQAAVKALTVKRQAVVGVLVAVRLMAVLAEQVKPEEVEILHQLPHLKVTMVAVVKRQLQHQMVAAVVVQVRQAQIQYLQAQGEPEETALRHLLLACLSHTRVAVQV